MRQQKEMRGWRGIVFNRAFVALAALIVVGLIEHPWAALCLLALAIAGGIAALIIRAINEQ